MLTELDQPEAQDRRHQAKSQLRRESRPDVMQIKIAILTSMAPQDILIVKLGALGDVLRTTPLLRRLPGRITWVTDQECLPLLAGAPRLDRVVPLSEASSLRGRAFATIINFDEDIRACRLAASLTARRRIGARLESGRVTYCRGSAPWFDMSLVSRLGREAANRLKMRGRRTYQDYLFAACGLRFLDEEYVLPIQPARSRGQAVALEARVGEKWPRKAWPGFPALAASLRAEGVRTTVLRQRWRLIDYLDDINRASLVVASDTFAMHAGLALRKQVVALFTCTSADEIHGYGLMTKLVDSRVRDFFYHRDQPRGLDTSITPGKVLNSIVRRLKQTPTPVARGART